MEGLSTSWGTCFDTSVNKLNINIILDNLNFIPGPNGTTVYSKLLTFSAFIFLGP